MKTQHNSDSYDILSEIRDDATLLAGLPGASKNMVYFAATLAELDNQRAALARYRRLWGAIGQAAVGIHAASTALNRAMNFSGPSRAEFDAMIADFHRRGWLTLSQNENQLSSSDLQRLSTEAESLETAARAASEPAIKERLYADYDAKRSAANQAEKQLHIQRLNTIILPDGQAAQMLRLLINPVVQAREAA